MKQNGKRIILNCETLETRFAQLNNGALEEYRIERADDEPKVGAIYLGRIVNLENSLQAAFVDIGAEKNAFLHYHDMLPDSAGEALDGEVIDVEEKKSEPEKNGKKKKGKATELQSREANRRRRKFTAAEIPEYFKPGMEILVQVVKSPISTKGARVTTNLSIAGRYLVLMPYSNHIGLSTKIENGQERTRLRKILDSLEVPEGMGLICRTVGEGRKSVFFKRDLEILMSSWNAVEEALDKGHAPMLAYSEPDLIDRTVRDFMTEEIDEIVVDDLKAYKHISDVVRRFGGRKMAGCVTCYKESAHIFDRYKVKEQLKNVFNRTVRLPGGGEIVVDETEALIAIDVNSGRGRKSVDQPEFVLQTNLEAAGEVARQLRLRNVGGLVVIDFIDMRSQRDRDEVYRTMKKLVKDDRAKTKVAPISKFGLMEMTRQREQESIQDKVYQTCPYCNGSGMVKSPMTMSVEIQRRLNAVFKNSAYKKVPIRVIMHPDVLARLKNEDAELLQELEEKHHHALSFRADPSMHCEEFQLLDADTGVEIK